MRWDCAAKPLILMVEDDAGVRARVRFVLEQAGFQVVEAADVAEAQACLAQQLPALMLLDWMLPGTKDEVPVFLFVVVVGQHRIPAVPYQVHKLRTRKGPFYQGNDDAKLCIIEYALLSIFVPLIVIPLQLADPS